MAKMYGDEEVLGTTLASIDKEFGKIFKGEESKPVKKVAYPKRAVVAKKTYTLELAHVKVHGVGCITKDSLLATILDLNLKLYDGKDAGLIKLHDDIKSTPI